MTHAPDSLDRSLRSRAAAVMPGALCGHQSVQLLPDAYPQFFARGKGAHTWDVNGNKYLDLMCAHGVQLFGYANEEIDAAAMEQMRRGEPLSGPTELMVRLAEALTDLVTHAQWAMFCKNGTDATTMAVVTARAHTKRRSIVLAKGLYHGAAPWCTPFTTGITLGERAHQIHYTYNDIETLDEAVDSARDDLAAIFVSPVKNDPFVDQALPDPAFARRARELCDRHGALLIIDDVRCGLRLARDCSWSALGVQPDLSCWGKCIGNGHPISALLGSASLREAAASIFTTGSFWYASSPMAAAVATLEKVAASNYLEQLQVLGLHLRAGLRERAEASGFTLRQSGPVQMPLFLFEEDVDLRLGFRWSSEMLQRGVYVHPWHNMFLSAAMTVADIDTALNAAEQAFAALKACRAELGPQEKVLAFFTNRRSQPPLL
jgi:glutamate-1-semialdehyde 2,1-aminomutase